MRVKTLPSFVSPDTRLVAWGRRPNAALAPQTVRVSTKNLCPRYTVVDRIPLHSLKPSPLDHGDDLGFGHLYFAFGGVGVGQFAAVGDGAADVVMPYGPPYTPEAGN